MKKIKINKKNPKFKTELFMDDEYKLFFVNDYNVKFNPSIISINDTYKLVCYRIWIDKYFNKQHKYPKPNTCGSPWVSGWTPYIYNNNIEVQNKYYDEYNNNSSIITNDKNILNNNFIGFMLLEFVNDELNIIFDQINQIKKYNYIEDFRLFVDSNNIVKIIGNVRFNEDIINNIQFKNENIKRGIVTYEINHINNILNNFFVNGRIEIKNDIILFPEHHNYVVEKNWVHFKCINNNDYILYFSFPYGSPIINLSLDISNNILIKNKYNINKTNYYVKTDVYFFNILNKYYFNSLRFSAGSCLIDFNENENIGIGHIVINLNKIKEAYLNDNNLNINYLIKKYNISKNGAINIINNILNIVCRPKKSAYIYDFHDKNKVYMMFFYTNSKFYPYNITKISHIFTPIIDNYNTGIVFPCGICKQKNDYIISYGESDNSCSFILLSHQYIENKLFCIESFNPALYQFINNDLFDKHKIINRLNN